MIQVSTKRHSQTDQYFLKNSLFSPRQLKRILYKHGLFRSKSNLPFTTLCDIVQVRYFFAVFHSPRKVLIPETILTKNQNYRQSNNSMLKLWCLLSFPLQIILKQFPLLIVTYTIEHFKFFTKIYHCFSLFHRKKQKATEVCQDTG